jgi:hypothetical protein
MSKHWLEANATPPPQQPLCLNPGRASHHHHSIAQGFAAGFIKKWDVSKEKIGRIAMGLRFGAPLAANARVKNFLESGLFRRARKDYGAKRGPIQVATGRKDLIAKFAPKFALNFLVKIDKSARRLIGIEKFRPRQNLPQAIAKARFACSDSPGNPDSGHSTTEQWKVALKKLIHGNALDP